MRQMTEIESEWGAAVNPQISDLEISPTHNVIDRQKEITILSSLKILKQ